MTENTAAWHAVWAGRVDILGDPTLALATRRPDRTPTTDLARCHATHASSNQPGAGPLAAVDGSTTTDWRPTQLPANLTVALAHQQTISTATS